MVEIKKNELPNHIGETIIFIDEDMVGHEYTLISIDGAWVKFMGNNSIVDILYEKIKDKILVKK